MRADLTLDSWVPVAAGSDFPIQNLPYGVFAAPGRQRRIGVAIGNGIFDLRAAFDAGLLPAVDAEVAQARTLDALLDAGPRLWGALRARLMELLRADTTALDGYDRGDLVVRQDAATMLMPFTPKDYVDFYSSREHATNLGKILRPNSEPLLPNWNWIPIGYHGRSSTIVVDGTPIVRPSGQIKPPGSAEPIFAPTRALDIELEMGFVTGPGNPMGTRIAPKDAAAHIFGLVLVNDWSARDIQAWEYQPLGPFLGKSFATSISPWIVTLQALEPFATTAPPQDPAALQHLADPQRHTYDIDLSIELQTASMRERGQEAEVIARSNFSRLYWTMAQQLAHVTSNGTAVRPGDLYASGTISGSEPDSSGSLIELTWRGEKPLHLASGETRAFLEDGDCITLRGWCRKGAMRIGFGKVGGTIVPAE